VSAAPRPAVVACDLDGVVWRGDDPVPPAADGIAALRDAGLRVAFVSNNSNSTVGDVVVKLGRMGIPAVADDVVTSALAAAWLLGHSLAPGARVLVCGGAGVREALADAGLEGVDDGPAEAVVVGFHRDFDFDALDRASRAVREGARFVATNLDATYPVPGGLIPGAGSLVAAVATAAGSEPEVAGKPEASTVGMIRERYGDVGVVVGDRPSTDGALATALEWPFALVLSGVTAAVAPPGGEAVPDPAPPFVGADLGALAPALITALRHT
jgi:glycerol 3-phosphatase-2